MDTWKKHPRFVLCKIKLHQIFQQIHDSKVWKRCLSNGAWTAHPRSVHVQAGSKLSICTFLRLDKVGVARVAENEMCNYNFATEVEKSLKGCIMIELHGHEIVGELQYEWAIILIHLQIINRYIVALFDVCRCASPRAPLSCTGASVL